ncbi:MAG: DNA primase [Candidatus Lokiarchaeota archaeon]|nr:DNA primase [Candidatus Lokiarchaeota archaeon]MBD3340153.1 DNA primase [Candidatus Lokiarchaeota archaeon]
MIKITNKYDGSSTDFTTKYIIDAEFMIKGVVEKSDIVGAIFGQTEGLLLDLDLRDLQKSGRIGRIEVINESKDGVSKGTISIPSSLTRKETALLAATVETVSRVGPCEAEISLKEITDVRETKRQQIIERAAELLKEWDSKSLEPSEIEEKIDTDIKLGEIISWGPDKLPAGPDIEQTEDLIIVEGRADVLNLLRIDIKNTVAVQGTQIPKSIINLTKKKKTTTAFLDGDRGGTIILNELLQVAKIDFVARAPEGYEVEELTRKKLIKALQNKKPVNSVTDKGNGKIETEYIEDRLYKMLKKLKVKDFKSVADAITEIQPGTSVGLSKKGEKLFELPVGEIFEKIRNYKNVVHLIFDGILTNRLLSISINMKIQFIACKNKEEDLRIPDNIMVYFF